MLTAALPHTPPDRPCCQVITGWQGGLTEVSITYTSLATGLLGFIRWEKFLLFNPGS